CATLTPPPHSGSWNVYW
nr:immunoglobulin heavy chain junction region [Macaca mulatta]